MAYRIYRGSKWPHPKRWFLKPTFPNRQKARGYCRSHQWDDIGALFIVHPDGTEEKYETGGSE